MLRFIRLLWDSTEAYRAMYCSSPAERRHSLEAHNRILEALSARDADRLVDEMDAHRTHAGRAEDEAVAGRRQGGRGTIR